MFVHVYAHKFDIESMTSTLTVTQCHASLITPPPTKVVGVIARWAWLNLELESRAC